LRRRIALVLALLLLVGVPLLADVIVRSVALGRLRPLVEEDLAEVLGLAVSVGELELSVIPTPHLEASDVRVANLPGRRMPHLLEIAELEIGIALWPLLDRQLVVDALTLRGVVLDVETDAEGGFELPLSLPELVDEEQGADDPFELHVRSLRVEDLDAFLIDGRTESVRSLRLDALDLDADELAGPLTLAATGELDGTAFELQGLTGSLRELLEPSEPFPVKLSGRVFDAEIGVEGTVAAPLDLEGLDLALTLRLPDLALSGWPLPRLGPIEIVARLSDLDGSLGLEEIAVETARADPLHARIEGTVDDLLELREVAVTGDVEARDLEFLEQLVEIPLPEIEVAQVHAELTDEDGSLGLVGQIHAEAGEGGVSLDVEGGYDDLWKIDEIDVAVRGQARDLATLAALVEGAPEMPRLGPVAVSGRVRDRDGTFAVDGLRIELGRRDDVWLVISGSVDDLLSQRGVALDARFSIRDLASLEGLLDRSLPTVAGIEGSARLTDADGSLGLEDVRVEIAGSGEVQLSLSASFDDLLERDEVSLTATLRARDLAAIGELGGVALPPVGPVEFAARVRGSDESLGADDVRLRLGETRVRGSFSGSFTDGERPMLRASVESPHIRLQDVGLTPDARRASPAPGAGQSEGPGVLPFEQLRAVDLELDLRAGRITGAAGLDVRDAHANVLLDDGELLIGNLAASYKRGRFVGEVHLDARRPEPELSLQVDVRAIDLARVLAQFESDTEGSGLIDLQVELRSEGRTPDEIVASLEGSSVFVLRDGTAASRYARMFVVNLAHTAFPMLRPRRQPRVGCVVADFEIEEGVATVRNLVVEEGEITVTGSGRVDFVRGVYDLELEPSTTNPGVVSMAPRVQVVGPLADPQFRPVKRTLASSMGRGLLSNARRAGGRLLRPFRSRGETVDAAEAACADVGLGP
jgi:uncharacterized protein involved in outer membrane biogenesis